MESANSPACASCRRLQAEVAALRAEMAQLRELLATARKDSSTSSKPPSSDIVKPPAPAADAAPARRSIGGQPGHPRHDRLPFPPGQLTLSQEHTPDVCP